MFRLGFAVRFLPMVFLSWSAIASEAGAGEPDVLVPAGVDDCFLAAPKVFWRTGASCPPASSPSDGEGGAAGDPEVVSRVAVHGSPVRKLFESNLPRQPGACNPYRFFSNIVADGQHLYWVDSYGLVRLSTAASVGDPPADFGGSIHGSEGLPPVELAQDAERVYGLIREAGGAATIRSVRKESALPATVRVLGGIAADLSADGEFLYWISGGDLQRLSLRESGSPVTTLAGGVTAYHAEGERTTRGVMTKYVFIARGRQVLRYNNVDGATTSAIYSSADPLARVYALTSDGLTLHLFESRTIPCSPEPCFKTANALLIRTGRTISPGETVYTFQGGVLGSELPDHLATDDVFVLWREKGKLLRLPAHPGGLQTDLEAFSIEVTQGVQDTSNSVPLIEDRRTFARVNVRSAGPPVPGVLAFLYRAAADGSAVGEPLLPLNPGTRITVQPSPSRSSLEESFLFELPFAWTHGSLSLRAEVNPHRNPPQASYDRNAITVGPLSFQPSPRLEAQFVGFGYALNDQAYFPRLEKDIAQTWSWARRAYPLSSAPGFSTDPSPGFRPNLWLVSDEGLASRVNRTAAECADGFCASNYVNSLLAAWRAEYGDEVFYYGMISDAAGFFPRGRPSPIAPVASGPAGASCCGNSAAWDADGSYADWYAGHLIGHTLGRGHPAPAADDPATLDVKEGCGHSPDDPSYPYSGAVIGLSAWGFDAGDPGLGLPRAVYPGSLWHDVMSYCPLRWISDYTYRGVYDFLAALPPAGRAEAGGQEGDWLSVFGDIVPGSETARIHHLRRLSGVIRIPPREPGNASLRLLGEDGSLLADYAFSPAGSEDGYLSFGMVVPFAPGTRQVEIADTVKPAVLARRAVSQNPPVVASVTLDAVPRPVTGPARLFWNADDPDGDPLTFDVLYSSNRGASFRPLFLNLSRTSVLIDTSVLGGGGAVLRVIAQDGAQSAQADMGPFAVLVKPPRPRILAPADGTRARYGQLVNLIGEAEDLQEGGVSGRGLVWTRGAEALGTGALLSLAVLPVGTHQLGLTATNAAGLSATAAVTVMVEDDLSLPGPTLSVGPLQVGWHAAAGNTELQTAEVSIANAGGGALNWKASKHAGWLALSKLSGAAPAVLTLSADASAFPPGTSLSGTVTIESDGDSGQAAQVITLPVTLAVGDVFEEEAPPVGPAFVRGDSNADGSVDISDAVNTLGFLFTGSGTITCADAADANSDGEVDISDAVNTLRFLFLGASAPPAPFPFCGVDSAADRAGCVGFEPCR